MEQKFEHFCKTFAVAPSLAKFVRAVWLLDHSSMPVCFCCLLTGESCCIINVRVL